MLLQDVVTTSAAVAETSGRLEKIGRLAELLRRLEPGEVAIAIAFLSGDLRQGRVGIGPAAIRDARPSSAAGEPALRLGEVDEAFERIASTSGAGTTPERTRLLRDLLRRATGDEQ